MSAMFHCGPKIPEGLTGGSGESPLNWLPDTTLSLPSLCCLEDCEHSRAPYAIGLKPPSLGLG